MIAAPGKETEVYFRMVYVLRERGFLLDECTNDYDIAKHPVTGITVHIGRTASLHDPIVASVSNLPPDSCKAWNSKGLSIMLDVAEEGLTR